VAREELRDVADAADVGVAVLLAEAEALAERRAELVAVEQLDAHAALEQIVLDALGERRLAGAGEPGEPEGEAFHRRRSFHLVFIASIRIFAISGRENSGGGIEPARSMSRTCVPESSTRSSGPAGLDLVEAMPPVRLHQNEFSNLSRSMPISPG